MNARDIGGEQVIADLKRVVCDSESLLLNSAGAVGEKAQEVRERLTHTLESAKATCRKLEEKAIAGAKATDKAVRENPYQSIAIGVGVGALIGYLVARKSSAHRG